MQDFLVSPFSVAFFATSILCIFSAIYLLRIPNSSKATHYFGVFVFGLSFVFGSFAVIDMGLSPAIGKYAWWTLHLFVIGSYGIMLFAYHYPTTMFEEEAKWAARISIPLTIIALAEYMYSTTFWNEPVYIFEAYSYNFVGEPIPGIVIGLQFGVCISVFIRKAAIYSEYNYNGYFKKFENSNSKLLRGLLRTADFVARVFNPGPKKEARMIVNFAGILPIIIIELAFIFIAVLGIASWAVTGYLVTVSLFIFLGYVIIVYLNDSPDRTTFMVKILGSTISLLLLVLGLAGFLASIEFESVFDNNRKSEIIFLKETLLGDKKETKTIPDSLEYIISIKDKPEIIYQKNNLFTEDLYKNNSLQNPSDWREGEFTRHYIKLEPLNPENYYLGYRFILNGEKMEAGYSYRNYRENLHRIESKLIYLIFGVAVFVTLVFPYFFRVSIILPLESLIKGIVEVNSGDMTVYVPIRTEDEIGFLTRSFNAMVESIRISRDKLQDYADNLEEMVKARTLELSEAKKETDRILQNVKEGIFLLYKNSDNYETGSQYSNELISIFENQDLSKLNFLEWIEIHSSSNTSQNARKYLKLLFNPNMDMEMILPLNPLTEIALQFNDKSKILAFDFSRIYDGNKIAWLMVTVSDITEKVTMAEELKKSEKKSRTQMEMLFSIFQIEPALLSDFLTSSEEEVEKVEFYFSEKDSRTPVDKLDDFFRSIHSIKGNSALLELNFLSEEAHELENKISEIKKQKNPAIEEFASLAPLFEKIKTILEEIENMLNKIMLFQSNYGSAKTNTKALILQAVEKNSRSLAERFGKKINLDSRNLNLEKLPDKYRFLVKDILVQTIRNSVSHGIETPEERIHFKKPDSGTITLSGGIQGNEYILMIKDDGRGLNLEKLTEKAIEKEHWTIEESKKATKEDKINLIFLEDVSTAETVTDISGRGVGMGLIKQKLIQMGGSVKVKTEQGEFTSFTFSFKI